MSSDAICGRKVYRTKRHLYRLSSTIAHRLNISYDRRTRTHDVSKVREPDQAQQSTIIQFYSSVDNIGNYLPVLAIQDLIGQTTDTWCMHNTNIDFDYINQAYSCGIIGGAGLLDQGFEPFWQLLAKRCSLPLIIWGVGSCIPDTRQQIGVDPELVSTVAERCALINVRDQLTVENYSLSGASVTPCPTVYYLRRYSAQQRPNSQPLFAYHDELIGDDEKGDITSILQRRFPDLVLTDNIQRPNWGLDDIIRSDYAVASMVITTRLHGAIIAYGLGVPFVSLCRDNKLRAFSAEYAPNTAFESLDDLVRALPDLSMLTPGRPLLSDHEKFAHRVRQWLVTTHS